MANDAQAPTPTACERRPLLVVMTCGHADESVCLPCWEAALARARAEEREAFVERLAAWRDLILREGAARGMDVSTEAKIADLMIGWVKRRGAPEELAFPKASERGQK